MICVGCTVQSDNNDSKDTEGKTSVSVSQSTENAKDKKADKKSDKAKNEQTTLKRADGDYEAEVITIESGDKSDNSSDKKETTTEKNGENKREETTSSPKETPVIPIP